MSLKDSIGEEDHPNKEEGNHFEVRTTAICIGCLSKRILEDPQKYNGQADTISDKDHRNH